jgi:hypothetical protein
MKLIHKMTSSVPTRFPVHGHPTFTDIFHSGKYGVPIPKQETEENLKEIKDWNWEKVISAIQGDYKRND